MTMTSVKNKIGEAMINAGATLTEKGEKIANKNPSIAKQNILNIDFAAPPGTGFTYTKARQQVRFK